ncbi:hypothetical protein ACFWNG_10135 [Streptomyces sp. NPDC058391]|uniref:hypothetical protein n=1 Tax=Streptomyces sp. NPDC058391 TaxID=3346476 RepID=UPI0036502829
MNEVRPQLDELLFSSVEGVFVESVEVSDTVVRVEARTTGEGGAGRVITLADGPAVRRRKLWEEIRKRGYPDGYGNVRNYVSRSLRGKPQPAGPGRHRPAP